MDLYVTGVVMAKRIPRDPTITKNSDRYKQMRRGDYEKHMYLCKDDEGSAMKFGLVIWMDQKRVYCLTSEANINEVCSCRRRSKEVRIIMKRPRTKGDRATQPVHRWG
jgi:hypothetical protein